MSDGNKNGFGHNSTVPGARLREIIRRLARIDEEMAALGEDKSAIRQQAKGEGFDVKIINIVMNRRRRDPDVLAETDALVEMYERALNALGDDE